MKAWLVVFMVLSVVLGVKSQKANVTKLSIENPGEIVDTINDARREFAKNLSVTNMWKLEWSDDLVQKIKKLPKDCNELASGSDYRYAYAGLDEKGSERVEKERNDLVNSGNIAKMRRDTGYLFEIIQPAQKKIGCGPYKCIDLRSAFPGRSPLISANEICLFGPSASFELKFEKGEVGSKCAKEGGKNDDGLCVPNGSSTLYTCPIMFFMILLVSFSTDSDFYSNSNH